MATDTPENGLDEMANTAGRLKIIIGVDYGTTFTGKCLWETA